MLKTFAKGGVHPPENKISVNQKLEKLPLPKTVTIPISQHIGAPAIPVVNKNDIVKTGQLIAKSGGFVSTNIHSSVSGKVVKIDAMLDSTGYKQKAVVINVEGDEWEESIDHNPALIKDITLTAEEIIKKVNDAGIVGLGGATFPSHVKLSVPKDKKVDCLIINGVECEPYLTSDHQLMLEKADEIMVGTQILKKALNVTKALIGIENNKPDAIQHLTETTKKYEGIEVYSLKVKYPQGGEKQLIKALINREVPSGKLPLDVNTVVHNVGTAYAVYEAVQKNKPLIERIVTITGKSVKKPSNFITRIGTPVSELIEASGGLPEDTGKIINGGPMMGKTLNSTDVPVTKGTSGILLIPEKETKRRQLQNCIRCAKCVTVCPMGLEPYILMSLTEKKMFDKAEAEKILDCMECGSCSYICPSDRPLLDYIRLGKSTVNKIIRSRN
ncbi:MAG: electron transport complex subunit RsxC [Bacteroidales bacterium]|nr:electron transport complex subunit RsxC [Bacteroidales bacterium]